MYEKLSKLRLVLFVNPRFWLESKILSIIECDIMYQLVILVWPSCQQTLVGAARAVRALRAVWPGPGSSQVVQLLLLSDLSPCQPGHSQKSQLRRDTSAPLSSSSAPPQLLLSSWTSWLLNSFALEFLSSIQLLSSPVALRSLASKLLSS